MNKFWRLIIGIRNFSYQMAIKDVGLARADKEYKLKFWGLTSGYGFALFFVLYILSLNFHDGLTLRKIEDYILPIKLLISMVILYLPMKWVNHLLLKKVEHVPIPKEFDKEKYNKNGLIYAGVFLVGYCLWVAVLLFGIYMWN